MKTLSIIIPNLEIGGAEKNAVMLANGFSQLGYDVEMVLLQAKGPLINLLDSNVKLIDLKSHGIVSHLQKLFEYFRANKRDSILAFMFPLTFFAAIACKWYCPQTRIVLTERTTFSKNFFKSRNLNILKQFVIKIVMNFLYLSVNTVVLVSEQALIELKRFLKWKSKIDFKVIYNPIQLTDANHSDGQEILEKWSRGDARKILSIGRLCAEKNYSLLIQSFAKLVQKENVRLLILGDGPERIKLERMIIDYGLYDKVLMPGFITNTKLFYQHTDLYVLSSVTEGFPNVLLEALSFGLKIVSTDCLSGPREILENGKYGVLVPTNDVDALFHAMDDTLRLDHQSEWVKSRIEAFTIEKAIQAYTQVLFG